MAVPSAWLAWGGWLKIWMWPMQLGWLNSLKSVGLGLLKFFFSHQLSRLALRVMFSAVLQLYSGELTEEAFSTWDCQ